MVREIGRHGVAATVQARLRRLGCAVLKVHGSPLQPAAVDFVAVAPCGHAVALEAKAPGKDATPRQRAFLAAWGERGAIVGVVTSADEVEVLIGGHTCGLR